MRPLKFYVELVLFSQRPWPLGYGLPFPHDGNPGCRPIIHRSNKEHVWHAKGQLDKWSKGKEKVMMYAFFLKKNPNQSEWRLCESWEDKQDFSIQMDIDDR